MIISPKKTFGNPFDDKNITPNYLGRFADDVTAKLIKNNTNGDYDGLITPIQTAMIPLRSELSQVDTTLNVQVGKTATVDSFIIDFKKYMSTNYVFIAAALGGEKSEAFGEFYPNGKSEYSNVTKTKLPTIMDRLNTVGETYKNQLGATISTQLKAFQTQWKPLRQEQLEGKSAVKTNRADRSVARKGVEIELIKIIHFIGNKFPGDEKQCMVFFDFNLLFGVKRGKKDATTPPVL